MALNISAWAIRKPVPSLVLFVVLFALGIVHFQNLPITRMPNIDLPLVSISVNQAGAAPSELETQVTKKIEASVAGLSGVKHISSSLSEGTALTTVEFRLETEVDRAVNDVRDAVAKIRSDLPQGIEEPLIQRIDVEGLPIVTYAAAAAQLSPEELSWFIDDTLIRALQGVRGVAQVGREGGVEREIRVALDPDRLIALGVTAAEVNAQLRATNVDLAGGRGEVGTQEQSIRTLAGATSVAALADTRITLSGGREARLRDLGQVSDGPAEARTFARLDGQPVVAISIYRAKGYSDVVVADAVAQKIAELQQQHPKVSIQLIDTMVKYTLSDYRSAMHTLIEGAILAVIVVWIFLRDFRATLISILAIPLSILPTFWIMDSLDFSLNAVSLLAITLVTGILVDDAIVEIENIVRHMRMGKSAYRAAIEAADEIGLAVVATTMTIVAVFMPVSFMGGIAGQYFKQFGITVAVAVTFSLAVARLITPLLAAYFLRADHAQQHQEPAWLRLYMRILQRAVLHRWITMLLGIALFIGSIMLAGLLPSGFLPNNDISRSILSIELPPGSTLEDSDRTVKQVSALFKARPEVQNVYATAGGATNRGFGAGEVRKATMIINLIPRSQRSTGQKQFETEMSAVLRNIADTRFSFASGNGQREVSVILSGNDGAAVEQAAVAIEAQMRKLPLLANVASTAALDRPEIRILPKLDQAAQLGISVAQIAETVRIGTLGDISANLAKFSAGDRQIPIRVQLQEHSRRTLDILEALRITGTQGYSVPLSAVAEIQFGQGPTALERYDRNRRIALEADLVGNTALGEALAAIYALPAAQQLPAGVVIKEFGDAEVMQEVFSGFALAMGAGLMMVLAVLILLFADVLQPITILLSLPLCIGGALLALLLSNNAISLPVVIGFLMLMGIVTKNAILLVDFAIEAMQQGMPRQQALLEAGHKRAQPIVMTTVAMAAGMLPSALGLGDGGDFRAPMAIAVIGGLLASTLLSLVFVPAVFSLMDDIGRFGRRWFAPLIGPKDEPPPPQFGIIGQTATSTNG